MASKFQITVPTFFGTESTLAYEITSLGYETTEVADGKVTLDGDWEAVALLNVNLRCGERVLIRLAQFNAVVFEELFQGVYNLPWEEFIGENDEFPVVGSSLKSQLHSVPACQSIIKKAVVKRLSLRYGREHFEETGNKLIIRFTIFKDVCTVYLDTSGVPLYKRGYRTAGVEAPMRETLAFSMVDVSRWRGDRPFLDPFCGSGTIPIEAAMYALNIAPGLKRPFLAESWDCMDSRLWADAREEARENENRDAQTHIFASDIDPKAVETAMANAKRAGVADRIHFSVCDMSKAREFKEKGIVMCNPPYGERLMDKKSCEGLYRAMGRKFSRYTEAAKLILTSHEEFEKFY
ncbi:MAG: class I SAM-dependent RNA methyltransferase, partial [Clostridia bacterium]